MFRESASLERFYQKCHHHNIRDSRKVIQSDSQHQNTLEIAISSTLASKNKYYIMLPVFLA